MDASHGQVAFCFRAVDETSDRDGPKAEVGLELSLWDEKQSVG